MMARRIRSRPTPPTRSGDDLDQDCDGIDGVDCDDTNDEVNTDAIEICNGIDDNCDDERGVIEIDGESSGSVDEALDAADPGDTINLCAGTHAVNLIIDQDITRQGHPSSDDVTLLPAVPGSIVQTTDGEVAIRGITFTGGTGTTVVQTRGGAIYASAGNSLSLSDVQPINNSAYLGGGVYAANMAVNVDQVVFRSNQSSSERGGLYFTSRDNSHTISVTNSTFLQNDANENGGGAFLLGGSGVLSHVVFTDNLALNVAGGLATLGNRGNGQYTLSDVEFTGNVGDHAGGLHSEGLDLFVQNSTFIGNVATYTGGAA